MKLKYKLSCIVTALVFALSAGMISASANTANSGAPQIVSGLKKVGRVTKNGAKAGYRGTKSGVKTGYKYSKSGVKTGYHYGRKGTKATISRTRKTGRTAITGSSRKRRRQ